MDLDIRSPWFRVVFGLVLVAAAWALHHWLWNKDPLIGYVLPSGLLLAGLIFIFAKTNGEKNRIP